MRTNVALLVIFAISSASSHLDGKNQESRDGSLISVLRRPFADANSEIRYHSASIDLNGDGLNEVIAYVYGQYVCGTGGCETLVLSPTASGYRIVSKIAISRPPIAVLPVKDKSWRRLAVFVVGGGIQPGYYAELRFDGKTYPENPTIVPAHPLRGKPNGTVVIPDLRYEQGKVLIEGRK
jgi:hypothetical protein